MTGLDRVIRASLESSGESLELTYKQLIKPVVELLVNKHTAISSGSSSATATAAGSIYFLMNDSREAMTSDMVRSILGQDRIIRDRVDQAVQGLSEIYALSAEQQNKLKIVIYDEILRQAVANNFALESSAYQLDLVRLMADKKIIDTSTAKAVFEIREKVQKLTESVVVDANMREVTLQNIDLALQLAALLESQLANPKLQNKTVRAEVERMLGSVHGRLTVVGFNLKKSDVMTSR
jgi:hypothetical protein